MKKTKIEWKYPPKDMPTLGQSVRFKIVWCEHDE